jgi:hypothetical protein
MKEKVKKFDGRLTDRFIFDGSTLFRFDEESDTHVSGYITRPRKTKEQKSQQYC